MFFFTHSNSRVNWERTTKQEIKAPMRTRECKGFIIINVIDVDCRKLWEYKGFR